MVNEEVPGRPLSTHPPAPRPPPRAPPSHARPQDNDAGDLKIRQLIDTLDLRKDEAIERTFKGVAKQFRDVFAQVGGCRVCWMGGWMHGVRGRRSSVPWAAPGLGVRWHNLQAGFVLLLHPFHSLSSSQCAALRRPWLPQLVPGGRGELVMQKRVAGQVGAEDENDDPEGGGGGGAAGGSKHSGGALEKYSGVKVKVRCGVWWGGCGGVGVGSLGLSFVRRKVCPVSRLKSLFSEPPPPPLFTAPRPPAPRCRLAAARRCR